MRGVTLRILIVLSILLSISFPANSQITRLNENEIRVRAQLMDARVATVLGKTRLALLGLGKLLSRTIQTDEQLHEILKETTSEVGHIRAMLFLNKDGVIVADSSRENPIAVDLSERKYFKDAKAGNYRGLRVGKVLEGQTSGFPFIPLTVPVWSGDNFIGLIAAVLTPEELLLIDQRTRCELCVSVVSKDDGTMLNKFPNVSGLEGFIKSFSNDHRAASGYAIINTGDLDAKVSWITNELFPVKSIFLEFIQK